MQNHRRGLNLNMMNSQDNKGLSKASAAIAKHTKFTNSANGGR